jgi:radical SAM protein with 4Fe4S-binding SPASM domain
MHNLATSIYNAHIDVVHGCQLRCIGCPNSTLQPKVHRMSAENFQRILGNIDVEKIHTLRLFNYGEPLLHQDLSTLVAMIPQQKFKTSIVELSTNAQQVYWEDFEKLVRLEVVNRLVVSCDGDGTPEDYEAKRPPSKWEKLIEFLERARRLRDRYAPAMQLITSTVCTDELHRKRWQDVLLPRGWTPKFRRWMLLPQSVSNMTGGPPVVPMSSCLYVSAADRFTAHKWDGQINLLYVDYDGTVVPCCQHPRAGVLGNLLENSYNDILLGKQRADFVRQLETNRASMPACGGCDVGPPEAPGPSFNAAMDN